MDRISRFVAERILLVWILVLLGAGVAGLQAGLLARDIREYERLDRLETEVGRLGIELMSQTLNGNLMGALGLLGLMDEGIKREALGQLAPNGDVNSRTLESITQAYGIDGTFIVGQDSVIKSSWGVGKSLTGVDVRFRPYARMVLRGKSNVYAAIGTTTGRRTLYFAAPLRAGQSIDTPVIGAVVGRSGVVELDQLLTGRADIALLLSPQDLVFAGSHSEWIGHLAGAPTPEHLKAIRELKQFGAMFDERDPEILPVGVANGFQDFDGKRYAVASAPVNWNDPTGPWKLVMMEDLGRTVPAAESAWIGLGSGVLVLLIGTLLLHALRDRHARTLASIELAAYARAQEASAERKTRLAAAAVRMQQASSLTEVARIFLAEAHALLGVPQGVVYLAGRADGTLHLAGGYACVDQPAAELAPGEGLLGQCAVDRIAQVIPVVPRGFALIRSGLGEARPAAVIIAPVQRSEVLLGVVEVALLHMPDDALRELFEELSGLLAINVEILGRAESELASQAASKESKA